MGTLYLLRKIISLILTLWGIEKAYFLAPWGIFRTNLKKYGPWAGEFDTESSVTVASLVNHNYVYTYAFNHSSFIYDLTKQLLRA